jgi:hypothetical protein
MQAWTAGSFDRASSSVRRLINGFLDETHKNKNARLWPGAFILCS